MKKPKTSLMPLLILSFLFLLCIDAKAISLNVGETYTCDIGNISYLVGVQWTSSDPSIIDFTSIPGSYSTSVIIQALKGSSLPIVVHCTYYYRELDPVSGRYTYQRSGYKSWTFYVNEPVPSPQSVTISPSSLTLNIGTTYSLSYSVYPSSADQSLSWSSSNTVVATVSRGNVTANSVGTATIWATTSNGLEASCRVTVRNPNPTRVELPANKRIKIGQGVQLTPTLYPSDASTTYTWESSDDAIVRVNTSGYITGISEGVARISVTTANGLYDYCEVEVYKPIPTSITLNSPSERMAIGSKKKITFTVTPSDAIYTQSWTSDAAQIADVNQQGDVTAIASGTAHITVMLDNGLSATCSVTVAPEPTALLLSPEIPDLTIGQTLQLALDVQPVDALASTYNWTSSDNSIATVSQTGLVTAQKPGNVTITVASNNGCSAKAQITVRVPVYKFLVVKRDGSIDEYSISDKPEVKVSSDLLTLVTQYESIEYAYPDVSQFMLKDVSDSDVHTTSVQNSMNTSLHGMTYNGNSLTIHSLRPYSSVRLYNISGHHLFEVQADATGTINIYLSNLAKGLYIVKTETTTYKILRR